MKKLRYLLVLLIAFTIIGCGGGNTDDSADDSATIPTQGDDATPNNPAQDDEQTPDESTVVSYSTISFDSNGGSDVSSIRVVQGEEVSEPTEPTYEGMTFVCWCYDEELSEKVEWPLVVDKNYTLYAKWNVEVDIVAYLETLLDYQIFNPYNMIPETLKPGYSSNVVSKSDYEFSSSVNVSSMPGNGHGEQWNMVVENLEQSQTFFNVLSVVETVSTSSVVIFQNYFDENPSEVANYSFKNGEYNVCVIFDGQYISYVLDYVANIPLLGEQKVQILLSMDVESGERIVRIQLGDSNALRYTVLDGYYEFAIKYLGVRTAYFSLYYDDEDILNGHIYENLLVEGVGLKSAADFYISDTYATIVGNKSSGLIGFTGYIVELYDVVTGKLISYEVMETQTISSVNVTFNTLWFDLHDVGGINSVKFVAAETNDDDDLFYINGSSSAWDQLLSASLYYISVTFSRKSPSYLQNC